MSVPLPVARAGRSGSAASRSPSGRPTVPGRASRPGRDVSNRTETPSDGAPAAATVLVVDDHPVFRRGLCAVLDGEPWVGSVTEAGTAGDGLGQAVRCRPGLIALDIRLPDRDGLELLPELRRSCPDAAVVLLTMCVEPELVRRSLALGARGYVLKGSEPAAVLAALRAAWSGGTALGPSVTLPAAEPPAGVPQPFDQLTSRELQVALEVAAGRGTGQIARRLQVSEKTVRNLVSAVLAKAGVRDRVALALLAHQRGLAEPQVRPVR